MCISCCKFSSEGCFSFPKTLMLSFIFIQLTVFLYYPLIFPLWPMDYLKSCCLVYKNLKVFLLSFCYWFLVWFHVVRERTLYDFNYNQLVGVLGGPAYCLSWCMFHEYLKRMCILLLDEVLYKYPLDPAGWSLLGPCISLLIFYLLSISCWEKFWSLHL